MSQVLANSSFFLRYKKTKQKHWKLLASNKSQLEIGQKIANRQIVDEIEPNIQKNFIIIACQMKTKNLVGIYLYTEGG